MGCLITKETNPFNLFLDKIKDEAKEKSVFQYQINHFHMLKVQKKMLPSIQAITETQITRIKNNRRLEDLKKFFKAIPLKDEDYKDVVTMRGNLKCLDFLLSTFKKEIEAIIKRENCLIETKKRLINLNRIKSILEERLILLETKINKSKLIRSYSVGQKLVEVQDKPKIKSWDEIKQTMHSRFVKCIGCLENIEEKAKVIKFYKLTEYTDKICKLESRISGLKTQKEELLAPSRFYDIEKSMGDGVAQIAVEVNHIKMEHKKVEELNRTLYSELNQFNSA
jgi:hypothetical protein